MGVDDILSYDLFIFAQKRQISFTRIGQNHYVQTEQFKRGERIATATSSLPLTLCNLVACYNTMLSSVLLESLFPHCISANVILGLIAACFYLVRDDIFSQGASSDDLVKRMSPLLKKAFHNVVAAVLVIAIALLCASLFAYQLKHINKDPVGIVQSRKHFSVRYEGPYDQNGDFNALTNISYDGSTVAAAAGYFSGGTSVVYLGSWTLGNLLTQQESLLSLSAVAIASSFPNYFFQWLLE